MGWFRNLYTNTIEFVGTFLSLSDVGPTTYTGQADKIVQINGAETGLEFTAKSALGLDHTTDLANVGTNTHAQIDTHLANSLIHFVEGSINHLNIQNIGVNSHAQLDTFKALVDSNLSLLASSIKLIIEADGTLKVNTVNYENLVTNDDDIPNKKYVVDNLPKVQYIFEDTTERDLFFVANPSYLITDTIIIIKDSTPPPTPGTRSLDFSKSFNSQYYPLLYP